MSSTVLNDNGYCEWGGSGQRQPLSSRAPAKLTNQTAAVNRVVIVDWSAFVWLEKHDAGDSSAPLSVDLLSSTSFSGTTLRPVGFSWIPQGALEGSPSCDRYEAATTPQPPLGVVVIVTRRHIVVLELSLACDGGGASLVAARELLVGGASVRGGDHSTVGRAGANEGANDDGDGGASPWTPPRRWRSSSCCGSTSHPLVVVEERPESLPPGGVPLAVCVSSTSFGDPKTAALSYSSSSNPPTVSLFVLWASAPTELRFCEVTLANCSGVLTPLAGRMSTTIPASAVLCGGGGNSSDECLNVAALRWCTSTVDCVSGMPCFAAAVDVMAVPGDPATRMLALATIADVTKRAERKQHEARVKREHERLAAMLLPLRPTDNNQNRGTALFAAKVEWGAVCVKVQEGPWKVEMTTISAPRFLFHACIPSSNAGAASSSSSSLLHQSQQQQQQQQLPPTLQKPSTACLSPLFALEDVLGVFVDTPLALASVAPFASRRSVGPSLPLRSAHAAATLQVIDSDASGGASADAPSATSGTTSFAARASQHSSFVIYSSRGVASSISLSGGRVIDAAVVSRRFASHDRLALQEALIVTVMETGELQLVRLCVQTEERSAYWHRRPTSAQGSSGASARLGGRVDGGGGGGGGGAVGSTSGAPSVVLLTLEARQLVVPCPATGAVGYRFVVDSSVALYSPATSAQDSKSCGVLGASRPYCTAGPCVVMVFVNNVPDSRDPNASFWEMCSVPLAAERASSSILESFQELFSEMEPLEVPRHQVRRVYSSTAYGEPSLPCSAADRQQLQRSTSSAASIRCGPRDDWVAVHRPHDHVRLVADHCGGGDGGDHIEVETIFLSFTGRIVVISRERGGVGRRVVALVGQIPIFDAKALRETHWCSRDALEEGVLFTIVSGAWTRLTMASEGAVGTGGHHCRTFALLVIAGDLQALLVLLTCVEASTGGDSTLHEANSSRIVSSGAFCPYRAKRVHASSCPSLPPAYDAAGTPNAPSDGGERDAGMVRAALDHFEPFLCCHLPTDGSPELNNIGGRKESGSTTDQDYDEVVFALSCVNGVGVMMLSLLTCRVEFSAGPCETDDSQPVTSGFVVMTDAVRGFVDCAPHFVAFGGPKRTKGKTSLSGFSTWDILFVAGGQLHVATARIPPSRRHLGVGGLGESAAARFLRVPASRDQQPTCAIRTLLTLERTPAQDFDVFGKPTAEATAAAKEFLSVSSLRWASIGCGAEVKGDTSTVPHRTPLHVAVLQCPSSLAIIELGRVPHASFGLESCGETFEVALFRLRRRDGKPPEGLMCFDVECSGSSTSDDPARRDGKSVTLMFYPSATSAGTAVYRREELSALAGGRVTSPSGRSRAVFCATRPVDVIEDDADDAFHGILHALGRGGGGASLLSSDGADDGRSSWISNGARASDAATAAVTVQENAGAAASDVRWVVWYQE